jgi:hypothetical protein
MAFIFTKMGFPSMHVIGLVGLIYYLCAGISRVLLPSPAKGYTKVLNGYPATSLARLHDHALFSMSLTKYSVEWNSMGGTRAQFFGNPHKGSLSGELVSPDHTQKLVYRITYEENKTQGI